MTESRFPVTGSRLLKGAESEGAPRIVTSLW
jgi:hypothetical protein